MLCVTLKHLLTPEEAIVSFCLLPCSQSGVECVAASERCKVLSLDHLMMQCKQLSVMHHAWLNIGVEICARKGVEGCLDSNPERCTTGITITTITYTRHARMGLSTLPLV